jgi:uncharacterized membrane protein
MHAVEPEGAAWGVRTVAVVALAVAMLVVLGAVVERLPLRARTLRARGLQRLAAVALVIGSLLLAVAGLALVARRTAATVGTALTGRPPGAAMAIGMGRFHRRRV